MFPCLYESFWKEFESERRLFTSNDHNQDPAVFKVTEINYNEKKKKNSKEKTTSALVFPIIGTVKPSFFGGFNENTDSRYNI